MDEIKELLLSYGDNEGWYNPQKIMEHYDETLIFWIIGARRLGKTDLFLRLACDLWKEHRLKTMWIRNKEVELSDPRFFNTFLSDALEFGWALEPWTVRADGVYESKARDAEKIIEFQAVSTFGNMRGGAHPDTVLMVFDEFMPEDRKYPKMCATALMSATKTVFSGRTNCRVFCLSNFVSGTNPYFASFQIYPEKGKDITICPGRMLIERCAGYRTAILDDNPWADVYRQGRYADYADEGEDPLMTLLKAPPKGCKPMPWILIKQQQAYRGWCKDGYVYWAQFNDRIPEQMVLYTDDLKETSDRVKRLPDWMVKQLKKGQDWFRFKDANCLYAIMSIIYDAV